MSVCMRTEQSFKGMRGALLWWGPRYSCPAQGPIHYSSLPGERMKERRPLAMLAQAHRRPSRVKHQPSYQNLPAGQVSTPPGLLRGWFCNKLCRWRSDQRSHIQHSSPEYTEPETWYNVNLTHSVPSYRHQGCLLPFKQVNKKQKVSEQFWAGKGNQVTLIVH